VQNQINDVNLDLGETNTRVASVENKTQKQSYNSSTLTTSFSNNLEFTSTLNNISTTVFGYLSNASENLQSAINSLKTRMTTAETALNPTGTIIQSVNGNIATNGYEPNYLLCDGRDVSRATYPALFNTIGIQYGWNNNATQFRLPDFRGVFLRGMGSVTRNNGVTYSSATNAYDFQADAIQDHTHSGQSGQYLGTNVSPQNNGYTFVSGNAPNSYSFASTGGMNTGRTATNTYPANFGIYYYIKT
jgi:microcystin-dependent protein